jgi:photosystem II stability/assembly factor-like uncharacterized protein
MLRRKNSSGGSGLVIALVALLVLVVGLAQTSAQQITPDLLKQLSFRTIGPFGNRSSAVVGVPGNILISYVGESSGGIWKTVDGGFTWRSIFDAQQVQSIGALAIAPSDPNIVWAGTGEPWVRSNISIGDGVYKSTDAGETWTHMGLEKTGRIGRVIIDPRNPDIVFVAAIGHAYGPQQERGVFRTTDGGKTWERVLFADENTGASELAMDPNNPRILFAGMWPIVLHTYGRESGGPNGGVYVSHDGGTTWKKIVGHGLPDAPVGKTMVAVAQTNSKRVYAVIETGGPPNRGVVWRSDDGGENWKCVNYGRLINERPPYAGRVAVSTGDENELYFAANSFTVSLDGGITANQVPWGGDNHDIWVDPKNPDRIMISNDGGGIISTDRGKSWNRINTLNAQMYHVDVDHQIPYNVIGSMQDAGSRRGPSNTIGGGGRGGGGISEANWGGTAGGEAAFVVFDPFDDFTVWGGNYNGMFTVVDHKTGHRRSVKVWPESTMGGPASEAKYRFNWTFPITMSTHVRNKAYVGSQYVHQTLDAGRSWTVISPDLSTNDPTKLGNSGGLTYDNLGVEFGCIVFAIAESPISEDEIWAGTNDGLVHVTRDGGKNWTNVTKNVPDLPVWGTVSNIEPSRFDKGTAYMTVDFHQMNNRDPFVYRTTDWGKTWKSISSDIPKTTLSYAHWIHEDPVRKGLLYLGVENALYVSFNDGQNWIPLQNNLPHAPVHHMVVQKNFNDLVLATYGRGFWILDDITPLQQLTPAVLSSDSHFFTPRPAYRLLGRTGGGAGRPVGSNPPYGAPINYYLKAAAKGPVRLSVVDDKGIVIRTLRGPGQPGINRVWWNLRYESIEQAKLRTVPAGNPHVLEEARFRQTWLEEGWYPIDGYGINGGFQGVLAPPGTYTLKLSVDGQELSQPLVVKKDPTSLGTEADIRAQLKTSLEIQANLKTVVGMVDQVEWMRKQLIDLRNVLRGDKNAPAILAAAEALEKKVTAVEDILFNPVLTEGDNKSFRGGNRLYEQLSILNDDVMQGADFAPTKQQGDVAEELTKKMATTQGQLINLVKQDLAAFNKMLQEKNLTGVVPVDR